MFFDAFELEFVERCPVWVAGCPRGRDFTHRNSAFRIEKIAKRLDRARQRPMRLWSPQSPISRHRLQVRIRCHHRALSLRQPHDGGVGDCDRLPWSWDNDAEPDGPVQTHLPGQLAARVSQPAAPNSVRGVSCLFPTWSMRWSQTWLWKTRTAS